MRPYSTVSPISQRLVQVHAIVEKIAGVNGPLGKKVFEFSSQDLHSKTHWATIYLLLICSPALSSKEQTEISHVEKKNSIKQHLSGQRKL